MKKYYLKIEVYELEEDKIGEKQYSYQGAVNRKVFQALSKFMVKFWFPKEEEIDKSV